MGFLRLAGAAFELVDSLTKELVKLTLRLLVGFVALLFMVVLGGLILSVPAGLFYAIYRAYPADEIEAKPNASWLDLIISNQFVVFAARIVLISLALVLLFAGIYISLSIFIRMYRREWLKRAGGLEAAITERAADQVDASKEQYDEVIDELLKENEALANLLEEATQELEGRTQGDDDDQDVPDEGAQGNDPEPRD